MSIKILNQCKSVIWKVYNKVTKMKILRCKIFGVRDVAH